MSLKKSRRAALSTAASDARTRMSVAGPIRGTCSSCASMFVSASTVSVSFPNRFTSARPSTGPTPLTAPPRR
eukprot:2615351-Pleurochrysis_carterae.AAC.1